jgi:uncharacterized protein (DUF427 family)
LNQPFRAYQVGAAEQSEHRCFMEETPKRVRVTFAGETIADSSRVLIMHETRHLPVYYFPIPDVRMDLMIATDHKTH